MGGLYSGRNESIMKKSPCINESQDDKEVVPWCFDGPPVVHESCKSYAAPKVHFFMLCGRLTLLGKVMVRGGETTGIVL